MLVIGGGITGAGIARDAAMRGLRTALVERDDFASGTSSRSSRLVHGGVRYLEHGHLHLVFESSRERRTLLRIAPHLVRPLRFTWPVYRGARIPLWKLGAGLFIYDALAVFRNVENHRLLASKEVTCQEPSLKREDLVGGAIYYDAATDDARLTLANVMAAEEAGAIAVNHAMVVRMVRDGDRIVGPIVRDDTSDIELSVRARVVVNATGPWTDVVRAMDGNGVGNTVRATKGVHIAVPRERLATHGALTLVSPADGRVMFALPSTATTILGTTDTRPANARRRCGHRARTSTTSSRRQLVLSIGAPNASRRRGRVGRNSTAHRVGVHRHPGECIARASYRSRPSGMISVSAS